MHFDWNNQRQRVFEDRYALKHNGDLLENSVVQMQERVASAIAHNASERHEFRDLLDDFRFLPAGRILSGAGSEQHSATFYNCFVLGINPIDPSHGKDSRDAILNSISRMVEITCRGGGVGINWSVLRPDKASVKGVHGTSTGPVGWMRGADALADQVRQGGSRTAALMFMLNDWHPDIIKFVESDKFLRANFSIAISDEFMEALSRNGSWTLTFPDTSDPAYDLLWDGDIKKWIEKGRRDVTTRTMTASYLWKSICESACRHGNPGIVFIDRCNQMSNTHYSERLTCTNPCGEQPLPEYGSCNLGSINLVSVCNSNGDINKQELSRVIRSAVKFLDNIIDKSPPLYSEINILQKLYRRIGLGTMGLADVLLLNKIRYGSLESLSFISELYSFIRYEAYKADADLAKDRGTAPMFSLEFLHSHMASGLEVFVADSIRLHGLRNMSVLTQAPTGTISILAGVSSGIEPVFSPEYIREDATGKYQVEHPLFRGSKESHMVTAHEITPEEHIAVQAELQKFLDSSISKTINMPRGTTPEEVDKAYRLGWETGVKGLTIYVDGSQGNILTGCPSGRCDI